MEIFLIVCLGIFLINPIIIFVVKYTISTAVMMENPVRSPIVPPISESILTNLTALSFVISLKRLAENRILMNLKFFNLLSYSTIIQD